jgi:hypothetical protein
MPNHLSVLIYATVLQIAHLDSVWYPDIHYFAKRATHTINLCFMHLIALE